MNNSTQPQSPLLMLPNELQLAVLQHLGQPGDVLRLGRTCRDLQALATSDDVWRGRVEALVRRHAAASSVKSVPAWSPGPGVYATHVDHLLGDGAKYLGEQAVRAL